MSQKNFAIRQTKIAGLLQIDLQKYEDDRGYFIESHRHDKLVEGGFPDDFTPVQHNFSRNTHAGVTRGIHAEPWDKYITMARGTVFVAIVDLRQGPDFGKLETFEVTENSALYIPRGCGNSYQTLETDSIYSYLVNDYWSPEAKYIFCDLFDPDLAINWPIAQKQAVISEKDTKHPRLGDLQ